MGLPAESEDHQQRLWPSVRLFMFILALVSSMVLGGGFSSFNFAIVCMVNETAITGSNVHRNNTSDIGSPTPKQCAVPNDDPEYNMGGGYDGEFAWDKATQAHLLAGHAFGGILMNLPSGLLSDRYGSKYVIAACVFANAVACALTPIAAFAGVNWLFAVRMLQGIGNGASWPSIIAMVSTWGTPSEAGTMLTLGAIGYQLGPLLAMATSSVICDSSFRWPMIFYLWACLSGAFTVVWLFLYTDDPKRCRFISKREVAFVQKNNMRKGQKRRSFWKAPWRYILLSPCAIAVYVCQFCSTWNTYYIGEFMPTYSKEVLHFDVRSNGIMSALPALSQCLARCVFGPLGDKFTFGGRSKTFSVKIFTLVCTLLPALCFLILGFVDCRQTSLAVASFCLTSVFLSSSTVGFSKAGVLMASQYAGLIGSLSNIFAFAAAIIMPYIVGVLVERGTVDEWRHSAFVVVGVMLTSFVQFQLFGTAERQKWAMDSKDPDGEVCAIDGSQPKDENGVAA